MSTNDNTLEGESQKLKDEWLHIRVNGMVGFRV